MTPLTNEQLSTLAEIVIETSGPCLTKDELTEQIALLLEDVAGFETAPDSEVHQVITEIRRRYYDTADQHKEG